MVVDVESVNIIVNNNLQYVDENTSKANHLFNTEYLTLEYRSVFSNELINKFVH